MKISTKRGYALLDVASALQKSIRRGDAKLAGYFGQELVASGFHNYVWKRLLTISAEDCHGLITKEVKALHQSFQFVNGNKPKKGDIKGRIFVSKAIIIMCQAPKSRDADHLQCLLYDKKVGITDEEIVQGIKDADGEPMVDLPEYTFDCHTMKGKREGKTKADFMQDEFEALQPRTLGLFDDLVEESA